MSETKGAFRRRLGRLLKVMRTGTTSGTGDTDTFICLPMSDYYPGDDTLNGAYVYDVTGAEWRTVTDWIASTGTATVNRAYTNSQASGRSIEVYEQFSPQELDDALQMALEEAYPYVVSRVVDTSLTGISGQYEYAVPGSIRDLHRMRGGRVQWQQNPAQATFPYVDFDHWEIRTSGVTQTLIIPAANEAVGRTIRLIGWGIPAFPSTDATTINLDGDTLQLLAYKAAEIVWRSGPGLTGRDAEFAAAMTSRFAKMYEDKKDEWGVVMTPTTLESPDGTNPYYDAPLAYYHTPSA